MSQEIIKEETATTEEATEVKQVRSPISACCIGIGMPAFVIWLAWALFPLMYHKDVLAGVHDFSDCTVVKFNTTTQSMVPTNETIEIA